MPLTSQTFFFFLLKINDQSHTTGFLNRRMKISSCSKLQERELKSTPRTDAMFGSMEVIKRQSKYSWWLARQQGKLYEPPPFIILCHPRPEHAAHLIRLSLSSLGETHRITAQARYPIAHQTGISKSNITCEHQNSIRIYSEKQLNAMPMLVF